MTKSESVVIHFPSPRNPLHSFVANEYPLQAAAEYRAALLAMLLRGLPEPELANATSEQASELEQTFADILTDVNSISDMASQIATASEEQVAVTRELAGSMESVSEAAILTLTGSQEITQVTGEQARLARVLQDLANEFKVPAYS